MQILKISKAEFETWGSHSLIGKVLMKGFQPGPITLSFEQTTNSWKEKNDGPDIIMMPEYVPMCLVQDILSLVTKHGFEVSVTEHFIDPIVSPY